MNSTAGILLAVTVALAVADWIAVARTPDQDGRSIAEWILKPLVMVALVGVMVTIDPVLPAPRTWFIAAAAASLAGDVFLLRPDRYFIPGLASFLVGHVCYIGGLAEFGLSGGRMGVMAALVVAALSVVGVRIVRGAAAGDRVLAGAVALYIAVISAMAVVAAGTGRWFAIAGAVIFMCSDACIGWSRFVAPFRGRRIAIMTTYHTAQILLTLALVYPGH